tara:strand:+ start:1161 stop:1430 length:270 start_codon:yes stop_codon:yes gene_type:complete
MAAMLDEHVPFLERGIVEKKGDPFAGCQLALAMLGIDPSLATAKPGLRPFGLEFGKNIGHLGVSEKTSELPPTYRMPARRINGFPVSAA